MFLDRYLGGNLCHITNSVGKLDVTQLSIISRTSQFFNLCRKYKKQPNAKIIFGCSYLIRLYICIQHCHKHVEALRGISICFLYFAFNVSRPEETQVFLNTY